MQTIYIQKKFRTVLRPFSSLCVEHITFDLYFSVHMSANPGLTTPDVVAPNYYTTALSYLNLTWPNDWVKICRWQSQVEQEIFVEICNVFAVFPTVVQFGFYARLRIHCSLSHPEENYTKKSLVGRKSVLLCWRGHDFSPAVCDALMFIQNFLWTVCLMASL